MFDGHVHVMVAFVRPPVAGPKVERMVGRRSSAESDSATV